MTSGVEGCWRKGRVLWYKVLGARNGEKGGRLQFGGERGSACWQNVNKIREGVGLVEEVGCLIILTNMGGDESSKLFQRDP